MKQENPTITLAEVLGDRSPGDIGSPDRFLIEEGFNRIDRRFFSKSGIYRAVRQVVPRPEYFDFELPEHERPDNIVSATVEHLTRILDSHREVYIKNTTTAVGGGDGLVKLTIDA